MIEQTVTNNTNQSQVVSNEQSIVPIDQLLNNDQTITQVNNEVINEPKKVDKILIAQISLLVIWAILTTLVYFFGYDFFEPFIKV